MSDPIPLPLHGSSEEVAEALQAVLSDLGLPTKWVEIVDDTDVKELRPIVLGPSQEVMIEPHIMPEKVRHIGADKDSWGWYVAQMVYDPGVRMYPDGSGEPPSWDEGESWSGRSYWEAVRQAIVWLIEELVDRAIENIALAMDEAQGDKWLEAQDLMADIRRERGLD